MKFRVSDIDGPLLDAAVAKAEGVKLVDRWTGPNGEYSVYSSEGEYRDSYTPSTSWAIGGQIIERERIAVLPGSGKVLGYGDSEGPERPEPPQWRAKMPNQQTYTLGPTPLIAAMRAFVHAKFAPHGRAFANEVELEPPG